MRVDESHLPHSKPARHDPPTELDPKRRPRWPHSSSRPGPTWKACLTPELDAALFPGAATPSVFAAGEPFWIGYGFDPEPGAENIGSEMFESETRFELEVDGEPVAIATDVISGEGGRVVSKHSLATFEAGLPAGWHRFSGRWYDQGRLSPLNRSFDPVRRALTSF